jgi:methionyl-tRNA synthetase
MLKFAGYRTPSQLFVNGFLTVNGAKMSKSRGTFITARSWLEQGKINPEALRYYFASKSNGSMEDADLHFDDMVAKVNSDLVGKVVNIASRCAGFIHDYCDGKIDEVDNNYLYSFTNSSVPNTGGLANPQKPLLCFEKEWSQDFGYQAISQPRVLDSYEEHNYAQAIRKIATLADYANQYLQERKPWILAKEGKISELRTVCSTAMTMFRDLVRYLKPVMPQLATKAEAFLNVEPFDFKGIWQPLPPGHQINQYEHLMTRIERPAIDALVEANKQTLAPVAAAKAEKPAQEASPSPKISIDDFLKVDLRVAKILSAEIVPDSTKLLKLSLDIGEAKSRQVFSGIQAAYDPKTLVGRLTVMVANLAPRKMKFGVSEGMVLCASDDAAPGLYLLSPDSGAMPGMRIK